MRHPLYAVIPVVLLGLACATTPRTDELRAVATLEGRSGSSAFGIVTFTETGDGIVAIRADLSNVPPGPHGFHVHETGDCSAADASSAGPHFDPGDDPHGGLHEVRSHAGDLGNVTASAAGRVQTEIRTSKLTVSSGPRSVIGRSVVLHADPDDLESQPAGDAGARIACGVVALSPSGR
jgi:superoxide dismutase, Cu-Zn family